MRDLIAYIDSNVDEFIEDLRILCQQPSISAQNKGIDECVKAIVKLMDKVGVDVKVVPIKDGNPVVFGETKVKKSSACLGFYNHYDVQPPEPLELWETPPFKADVRDGKIFARGVSDNKGNLVARLEAVRAVREVLGEVPINLKFLVDGEEEIGSPHLPLFVKENMKLLKADGYIWEGEGVDEKDRPVIALGYKGFLYVELRAKGAKTDVHSSRAPIIPNPAWRLIWALSSLKGLDERIKIPHWYDDVVPPTDEETRLLQESPFEEEAEKKELGLKEYLGGITGSESRKALYFSPTCNVCGFDAGYKGSGAKTILPSEAMVKIDFRLVEAQRPDVHFDMLKRYLKEKGFGDIEVIKHGGYEPSKTPPSNPFAVRIIKTAEKVYGSKPVVWPNSAGTSPTYMIKNWMGIPVASGGGVGYPGHNLHAPNENMRIKDYVNSIKYIATLITSYES